MMCNEFWPIIPNDRIVCVLNLIRKEEETDPCGLWLVLEHPVFVRSHQLGLAVLVRLAIGIGSKECRIDDILHQMPRLPPQVRYDEATECVDADVSRQDVTVRLVVEDRVEILIVRKDLSQRHFDDDQKSNNDGTGRGQRQVSAVCCRRRSRNFIVVTLLRRVVKTFLRKRFFRKQEQTTAAAAAAARRASLFLQLFSSFAAHDDGGGKVMMN